MSSKARRKRREWMQKVTEGEQWLASECNRLIAANHRAAEQRLVNLREDLTRMIPNDDENTFYPSGKIEQPYIQVACTRDTFERFSPEKFNPYYDNRMKVFALQAEQFAIVLPDGRKVVWWGWKLR